MDVHQLKHQYRHLKLMRLVKWEWGTRNSYQLQLFMEFPLYRIVAMTLSRSSRALSLSTIAASRSRIAKSRWAKTAFFSERAKFLSWMAASLSARMAISCSIVWGCINHWNKPKWQWSWGMLFVKENVYAAWSIQEWSCESKLLSSDFFLHDTWFWVVPWGWTFSLLISRSPPI